MGLFIVTYLCLMGFEFIQQHFFSSIIYFRRILFVCCLTCGVISSVIGSFVFFEFLQNTISIFVEFCFMFSSELEMAWINDKDQWREKKNTKNIDSAQNELCS